MGGHQFPGWGNPPYAPLTGTQTIQTEAQLTANPAAVLWPTSGPDVNVWGGSQDLTPNKNGQIVAP